MKHPVIIVLLFFAVYQQDPRLYQDTRAWGMPIPQQKGFILHDSPQEQRYLNGGEHSLSSNQHHMSSYSAAQNLFSQTPPTSASPQHRNAVSDAFRKFAKFIFLVYI